MKEKLRIAQVGVGRMGQKRASDLQSRVTGATLCALCDVDPERLASVGATLGVSARYEDFGAMLEAEAPDAVVVSNSSAEHAGIVLRAMEAGLDIFVEKPLALCYEDLSAIHSRAADYRGTLAVGYTRRMDPDYAGIREMLQSGRIGKPVMVRCAAAEGMGDADFLRVFTPKSGGNLMDLGVHDIDLACWLLGGQVRKVTAHGLAVSALYRELGDCDNYQITLEFDNDALAVITGSRTEGGDFAREVDVLGTKGSIRQRADCAGSVVVSDAKRSSTEKPANGMDAFLAKYDRLYTRELQAFVDCARQGTAPVAGLEAGVLAASIALAAKARIFA